MWAWFAGGLLAAALTSLTWWLLRGHTRGAEIAGVLALPIGVLAVVVPLFQSRTGDHLSRGEASPELTAEIAVCMAPVSRRDAHDLGVSPARLPEETRASRLPGLTPYLLRAHDRELREKIAKTASGGPSILAVLTGDSTIGKTRALYEALREHENVCQWPLASPVDADELNALLEERKIVPGTVLWLDEIQKYLFGSSGAKAARGLRKLLNSSQGIIIVGTTWLAHSTELLARGNPGDPHADARALLAGARADLISVPDHLTREQRLALAYGDLRLAEAAAASSENGHVIQHLTGGPEILIAYRTGVMFTPVEHALITAAIDARRLGHHEPISGELLAAAADGYLTPGQRPGAADWAITALIAITTGHRADGTRTDVRTLTALRAHRIASGQPDAGYEPDDFIYQPISTSRQDCLGSPALWDALARHGAAADLHRLGQEARDRGLYRHAALLWRQAVTLGDTEAALDLIASVSRLGAAAASDVCMWVARQATLDDPGHSGELLTRLQELGAEEAIAALLARDPVARIPPDDLSGCGHLLAALCKVGATDEITAMLTRDPASNAPVTVLEDDLYDLLDLLDALPKVQAPSAVTTLAGRIAHQLPLGNANWEADCSEIMRLVRELGKAGQVNAATVLANRIAAEMPLDNGLEVASVLKDLHELKATDALAALAIRVARHAPYASGISDPMEALHDVHETAALTILANRAVREAPAAYTPQSYLLLVALRDVGASEALAALADRAALNDPENVAWLLEDLAEVGADNAVRVLLSRDPASEVCLTRGTSGLLSLLWENGAHDAVRVLLSRDPASQIGLEDPASIAWLLEDLAEVGADDAVQVLLSRDPAASVLLHDLHGIGRLLGALDEVGAHSASAMLADRVSRQASLNCPPNVRFFSGERKPDTGYLLRAMHQVGAVDAMARLADRAARETALDRHGDVGYLLRAMHEVGAVDAMARLADRAARETALDNQDQVKGLLKAMHEIGAVEAVAIMLSRDLAAQVDLAERLLLLPPREDLADVLDDLGASDVAKSFLRRQADAGASRRAFQRLIRRMAAGALTDQLRLFGREPDSSPSQRWTWRDLAL